MHFISSLTMIKTSDKKIIKKILEQFNAKFLLFSRILFKNTIISSKKKNTYIINIFKNFKNFL